MLGESVECVSLSCPVLTSFWQPQSCRLWRWPKGYISIFCVNTTNCHTHVGVVSSDHINQLLVEVFLGVIDALRVVKDWETVLVLPSVRCMERNPVDQGVGPYCTVA